jgi:hypothetical protein
VSILASVLSLALTIAFATTAIQKIRLTTLQERTAARLAIATSRWRQEGWLEAIFAVGVALGYKASHASLLGVVNEVALGLLALVSAALWVRHLQRGDRVSQWAGVLALALASVIALLARAL